MTKRSPYRNQAFLKRQQLGWPVVSDCLVSGTEACASWLRRLSQSLALTTCEMHKIDSAVSIGTLSS